MFCGAQSLSSSPSLHSTVAEFGPLLNACAYAAESSLLLIDADEWRTFRSMVVAASPPKPTPIMAS